VRQGAAYGGFWHGLLGYASEIRGRRLGWWGTRASQQRESRYSHNAGFAPLSGYGASA
jgi:hypothetical protein